ncbi:hypothetical protein PR202_gb08715 [Eleusine coracana subsp. coracana]|uniref:Uncharacterized protein n=1 Tax=Eleusine coracana subsp. coracana TaxID=191504 RepID=A0AAV5ECW9_ELECO|nr:hypothetical protein QOZ80_2BG0188720 [Eleusine coracana subsp. coracana]GJN21253.1 hypothetical protein PR202_gb08715 [Eleusine coracana subsp. coracana]
MIPKKRPADERGGRAAKLSRRRRRRHLYLVLDDWEKGYSIRKLDLSSDSDSDDGPMDSIEQRLPPAVFRLEAPRGFCELFTSFGTKIIATHHTRRRNIPMWDVCTRALTFGPRHKVQPNPYCNAYVEVDDGYLILLDSGHFEMLVPPPPSPDDALGSIKVIWKWEHLPKPPFRHSVVSHAVHPDGRTIFYTTEKHNQNKRSKVATFSFDTQSGKWNRHGDWRLPFQGRGYFDLELDAWVGLSGDPTTLGHLCTCEVVSADAAAADEPPVWKLSKDRLFCVDPAEKHVGATLVYMGEEASSALCSASP